MPTINLIQPRKDVQRNIIHIVDNWSEMKDWILRYTRGRATERQRDHSTLYNTCKRNAGPDEYCYKSSVLSKELSNPPFEKIPVAGL